MVAREAVGPERDLLWRMILDEEPAFASFQEKTERIIPVMVLEPSPETTIAGAAVDISHA
jgi:hypothetical protein